MNRFNFIQTGGFPMDVNVLDQMQESYNIFNALGFVAGNFSIISGCIVTGNIVSDGTVFINGELYFFKGGSLGENVVIISQPESKEFENGNVHEVYFTRYATFGIATIVYPWIDFKRCYPTIAIPEALDLKEDKTTIAALITRLESLEKKNAVFQGGGAMVFWNKPANLIPEGWREVVDWKGRVPVGFDPAQTEFNSIGKTGGSKDAVVVSHSHTISNSGNINNGGGSTVAGKTARWDSGSGTLLNGTVSTVGESGIGKNLQPFRTVLFIEYYL